MVPEPGQGAAYQAQRFALEEARLVEESKESISLQDP